MPSSPSMPTRYDRDSFELASLASSDASERSLAPSSPAGISSSRRLSLEDEDPLSDKAGRPVHGRSLSVSSAFDFASNLFPLTSTTGYAPLGASAEATSLEKRKSLSYLNGLSLIIGLVIGSGIFSSPSQVNANAGSPGASLIVWIVAGLLVWTGASSYVELGGAIPLNGGAQVYLAKIFNELSGFLFSWSAVCVLKPGSAAIIAIIFGEYMVRVVIGAKAENVNPWVNKGVSLIGLLIVTAFNCASTKLSIRIGDGLMFIKFIVLLTVTIVGIVAAATGYAWDGNPNKEFKERSWFAGTSTRVEEWAVALYAGLWAFDGWDNVNYVTGELKNARRDLPRVIHTAMPTIMASYVLANIAYFLVLPMDAIAASNTVAVRFGSQVFGPVGGVVVALAVSASCFGALNATTFTSGRLVYVAGKEGYLPEIFGSLGEVKALQKVVSDGGQTPVYALLLNFVLTTIYILVGDFSELLTFYGVAGYTFYFLTVLGVIILRVREPNLERPYKTWITTPIIFCCVSLFLVLRGVINRPLQSLFVVAFVLAGIPVYWWRIRLRDGKKGWKFWS